MILPAAGAAFPSILCPRLRDGLPLDILNRVGSAAGKRYDVVFPIAGTGAARPTGRGAGMQPLKLPRYLARPMLARRSGAVAAMSAAAIGISAENRMAGSVRHKPPTKKGRHDRCAENDAQRGTGKIFACWLTG